MGPCTLITSFELMKWYHEMCITPSVNDKAVSALSFNVCGRVNRTFSVMEKKLS